MNLAPQVSFCRDFMAVHAPFFLKVGIKGRGLSIGRVT